MAENQIHGNIQGIRDTLLAEMAQLYEYPMERDQFLPPDMARALAAYSCTLNREIAVYISRENDVLDVVIGVTDSVPLADWHMRRNAKRLSCVRCIHTHPRSTAQLSGPDYAALRSLMLDAMCAVGVDENGHVNGVSAAFLGEKQNGVHTLIEVPPVPLRRIPQQAWMTQIAESDGLVLRGSDAALADAPEKALLVGIDSEKSLDELSALAESAGAQVVGRAFQRRARPDGATFIGSGKAAELQLTAQSLDADVVIFDDELSGVQTRNLENLIGVKVVDRTTLILDIFAQRAKSNEGKLQVSLAQMKYRASRLIGQGLVLSRLGGGIGTRGPGESKLEIDRRRIRERITDLRRELDAMEKHRELRRKSREKNVVPVVALVGYTNTGKSTLLNALTGADVYVQNQLFATLDAVSRRVVLRDGGEFLLVDTVGFISKLPHDLVEAFHSTLEEAALADVLVIVSDASNPEAAAQRDVVEEVLLKLHADTQPRIEVMNKCDLAPDTPSLIPGALHVSARTGEGMEGLLGAIAEKLRTAEQIYEVLVPFERYGLMSEMRRRGRVLSETHTEEGTLLRLALKTEDLQPLQSRCGHSLQFVKI